MGNFFSRIIKFEKVSKKVPALKAADALEGLKALVEAQKENHRVTEEQKTIREGIAAQKEIAIEEIRAKKEILLTYFDNIFEERRNNYQKFFEMLDKGIEDNNIELLQLATNAIVNIALDSPLKELKKFQLDNKLGEEVKKIDNFTI
jgi:hypothetical protein